MSFKLYVSYIVILLTLIVFSIHKYFEQLIELFRNFNFTNKSHKLSVEFKKKKWLFLLLINNLNENVYFA